MSGMDIDPPGTSGSGPPGGGDKRPPKGAKPAPWAGKTGRDKRTERQKHFAELSAKQRERANAQTTRQPSAAPSYARAVSNRYPGEVRPSEFAPGTYPQLFTSGPGHATFRRRIIPDVRYLVQYSEQVVNVLQQNPTWNHFLAEARQALGNQPGNLLARRFRLTLVASALVGLGQQVYWAHLNLGAEPFHIPALKQCSLSVFKSLAAIISQYGAFSLDVVGTRFLVENPVEYITHCVRLAGQLIPHMGDLLPTNNTVERLLNAWWIPVRIGDPIFTYIMATAMVDALSELTRIVLPVELVFNAMFPSEPSPIPDWWAGTWNSLVPEAERGDYDWCFQPFPATAEMFVGQWTGARANRMSARTRLQWANPQVNDLSWGTIVPSILQRVSHASAELDPVTRRFYHCASTSSMQSTARGSPMQLAAMETSTEQVTTVRSYVGMSPAVQSLGVAFPPVVYYDRQEITLHVINTTNALVREIATHWIQSDVMAAPVSSSAAAGH